VASDDLADNKSPGPPGAVPAHESAERYRTILDTAVDGIITIGEDAIIESFNRSAERIFGWAAEEAIGRNVSMLMPEPYHGEHDDYVSRYVSSGRAKVIGIGREVVGLRKDGSHFPMDLAIGEVRLGARRLFTGICRDISDRKAVEAEARRRLDDLVHVSRLASMGDMASVLAHEVNQPLTAIISLSGACVRLMESGKASEKLIFDSLQKILRQGERAGEVVRRMRSFVRKSELSFVPTSLNQIIDDVTWLMEHEIRENQVQIQRQFDVDLPAAAMDRVQIEQVIFNLVRNALDALELVPRSPRRIVLRTQSVVDGVNFEIEDNGPGFGERDPEELFEAYVTTKATGLGQGLSICRSIVAAHGGELTAGAGEAGGARFCLHLPLLQP